MRRSSWTAKCPGWTASKPPVSFGSRARECGTADPDRRAHRQCLAEARPACLRAGMNDYLCKPIQPERLAALLGRWISPAAPAPVELPPAAAAVAVDTVFDERDFLHRVMEDRPAAARIVAGFLSEAPFQLGRLRERLEEGDGRAPECRRTRSREPRPPYRRAPCAPSPVKRNKRR